MNTKQKLFIPVLDNGGGDVKASWAVCMIPAFNGRSIHLARASDSHANRGMNKCAADFLESDCTDWINIDADVEFTPFHISRLVSHDVPLVYGIYPKKEDATTPCLCTFSDGARPGPGELQEVKRCGRGFMRVRREVLEAMKEENGGPALRFHNHGRVEWDFFPSGPIIGEGQDEQGFPIREWLSEDWMFCDRARELGFPTLVDPRITLGHEGAKMYRFAKEQVQVVGWQAVPGWFTAADAETYRRIAKAIPINGKVAEIGSWMGRSLSALVTFCREEGKEPSIYAIDTFKGTPSETEAHAATVAEHGGSVRQVFEANIAKLGVGVCVLEEDSNAAAEAFTDDTLDALFIDGDHTYNAVRDNVANWLPKVRSRGIIAGHDYDYEDVALAVHELIPQSKIERIGRCWLYVKP